MRPNPLNKKRLTFLVPAALVLLAAGSARAGDPKDLARRIDQAIDARLREEKVPVSPRADDAEFLRRVYLDVVGHVPPIDKAAAFLDSKDPNKRAKLIDELLASPEYGKHQADVWQSLLLPRNSDNRRIRFAPMIEWLGENFNANKPWDKMVRELITASGGQDKNGAVTYFLANPTPDKLTDNVTRLFLGVRLECAQCHNHPFTSWKQDEYWGMAAFFTKVRLEGNPRQAMQNGGTLSINENGRGRPVRLPDSAKRLPPKFLQGEQPKIPSNEAYRPVLADWMTSPSNPYFSKAMVNRTFAQFFGRGLVNPVDDMHDANPPSHPELLDSLAREFAASGFDLKGLIRGICNSQAYQRTSKPRGSNVDASPAVFSHAAIKVMTPEQLFDSLVQVLGAPGQGPQARRPQGQQALRNPNANPRSAFVAFFQVDDTAEATEYQAGIPQALRLMNSPQLNNPNALNRYVKPGKSPVQVIEDLYLATLSRRPNARELERMTGYVRKHSDEPRKAYADVLWVLLNTSEFTLNH
jgi:hypothetical protein